MEVRITAYRYSTDDIIKTVSNCVQEELSFISAHILTIKQYQNVWENIWMMKI
jgi:hypothetical protein